MTVSERFLKYVSFNTQSDEESETCPSTAGQRKLGEALVEEMLAMGISDAYMDEDGYVFITGRCKSVIVLENGKNVFPEEIENYVQSIPYVTEVTVYSLKDGKGLESALAAEVYCDPERLAELGITELEATIKEDVKKNLSQLPSYKQINKIVLRDTEFPKNASQKIVRGKIEKK